jgi:hypothetical protein
LKIGADSSAEDNLGSRLFRMRIAVETNNITQKAGVDRQQHG